MRVLDKTWCRMVINDQGPAFGAVIILGFTFGIAVIGTVLAPFWVIGKGIQWLVREK